MYKIPANVMSFASSSKTGLFDAFLDYYNHYRYNNGKKDLTFATVDQSGKAISFEQKEKAINQMFRDEVINRSGVSYITGDTPVGEWFAHPNVKYESFAIVSALIDMIIPQTMIDSIGLFTDVRVGGWGDSFAFEVSARDLFPVTVAGKGMRSAEFQRQYRGLKTIVPTMHEVTVYASLYRILSGSDSLAEFTMKAARSIETQMTVDAYTAFAVAFDALSTSGNTQLKATGYSQTQLVDFCQKVEVYNQGNKPVIAGTKLALQNVLPLDANYRYDLVSSDYVKLGYIPTAFGYDMLMIPQVAAWQTPFTTVISDARLWIVSPSSQKIVKLCIEGSTLSKTNDPYDSAMLNQNTTLWKSWGVGVATNSIGAEIVLA